jgi:hypothetical protein
LDGLPGDRGDLELDRPAGLLLLDDGARGDLITRSARSRTALGTVIPSDLAVFRLVMTGSEPVRCRCTGRRSVCLKAAIVNAGFAASLSLRTGSSVSPAGDRQNDKLALELPFDDDVA